GKLVIVGNDHLLHRENIPHESCDPEGTVVHVAIDGTLAGRLLIADELKPDAAGALRSLKRLGVKRTVMLTGDAKEAAAHVAEAIGIEEVHAELLPDEKVLLLEKIAGERALGAGK